MRCTIALALLSLAAPTRAQSSWEASATGGYTLPAGLSNQAPELTSLKIRDGFTWGVQVSRSLTPKWTAEISWARQSSALKLETGAGSVELFSMNVAELHANALRLFGETDAKLRPFAFAGLGATFLSGRDLNSETKLSFGIGAGIKYFLWEKIGFRAQAAYKPTILSDGGSGRYCDPFGFCQGALHQLEFSGGVSYRF
jgi:opacity protein-like surface antigen